MFAFLHFSAAPKLSIKGQESTDVGRGQENACEEWCGQASLSASPVCLPICPFPRQTYQVEHHLLSIFLMPSPASDLSLESHGSGFSAGF